MGSVHTESFPSLVGLRHIKSFPSSVGCLSTESLASLVSTDTESLPSPGGETHSETFVSGRLREDLKALSDFDQVDLMTYPDLIECH